MSRYTPGPWSADPKRKLRIRDANDTTVGSCGTSDSIRDAWEGNALIMSVAPELLEALIELVREEFRDDDDPILDRARIKARNAIAKAEGK